MVSVKTRIRVVWQLQSHVFNVLFYRFSENGLGHFIGLQVLRSDLINFVLCQNVVCFDLVNIHGFLDFFEYIGRCIVEVYVGVIN